MRPLIGVADGLQVNIPVLWEVSLSVRAGRIGNSSMALKMPCLSDKTV